MAALPMGFGNSSKPKLLFPDVSISCVVIGRRERAVPCKIAEAYEADYNKTSWNISSKAASTFTVKAALKLNDDVYRQVSEYFKY